MTEKYAGLAGNQNAVKPEGKRKQGFTLHKYVSYPYVESIYGILGDNATEKQVREYALQICEEALKSRFSREHNAEYLGRIKDILSQHSGQSFTYTYPKRDASVFLLLGLDGLWYGEVSGGLDRCSACSFEIVVDSLRLNSWMDQSMLELVAAFEEQANKPEGDDNEQ